MSLVCEETPNYVKLGILKLISDILKETRKGKKIDLGLIDRLKLINQGKKGDFKVDENGVIRFRDMVYVPDVPKLKSIIL